MIHMKIHFGYKCSETQSPRAFFRTYFYDSQIIMLKVLYQIFT